MTRLKTSYKDDDFAVVIYVSSSVQNDPLGHREGWATPWSVDEMWMDNVKEWTSTHARARTAHDDLSHKRPEEDLC